MIKYGYIEKSYYKKEFGILKSNIMRGNIGYWFNKQFLKNYDEEKLLKDRKDKQGKKLFSYWVANQVAPALNANFDYYKKFQVFLPEGVEVNSNLNDNNIYVFKLTTTYPGLVCGIGYEHKIGFEGEFKLGFSFDYTTGMPYIPGSSIKGTLHSVFRYQEYLNKIMPDVLMKAKEENKQIKNDDLAEINWHILEYCIFEGKNYNGTMKGNIYAKDVFFDAFIINTVQENKWHFLADDYITSHQSENHKMSPFKEPNPVRFIKVRSGVDFYFQFCLHDEIMPNGRVFTATMKKELFQLILQDCGLGAKTNVGYGQFNGINQPDQ